MNYLFLALRNLARNHHRTGFALGTIGFGVIALLLAGGFIEWMFLAMRSGMIESQLGHIQVVRPGYFESGVAEPFGYLLPENLSDAAKLESTPGVKRLTPRMSFNGLISFGDNTVSFAGQGVDPIREPASSRWLGIIITAGKGLNEFDEQKVILGRGLANNLGATPGDTVTLLVNTASGGLNAIEAGVAGVFRTYTKAFDDVTLRVPISLARKLTRASGAHTWIVFLDKTERTDDVLKQFQAKYPASSSGLQFVPWYALADFYNKTVVLFSRQMGVVRVIIALIIVLSISNMLVMSVLERTGEIGTLLAIGDSRKRILMLFLSEGLLLGIVGGIAGLSLGLIMAYVISAIGIPMPPPPGADEGFTGEILVTWPLLLGSFVLAVLTTALSALYPAWKASRLEIVDALRHNR